MPSWRGSGTSWADHPDPARERELLLLGLIPGVGIRRLRALVTQYGDPLAVRRATVGSLSRVPGLGARIASDVNRFFRGPNLPGAELQATRMLIALRESGARLLHLWNPGYPPRLAAIYDAPPVLFVRGDLHRCAEPCVAVVGTRRPTPYGLAMAEYFGRELGAAGVTVVSGLARGVDTRAHSAAIDAGGKTIAVTGTGPETCYPPENRRLAGRIALSGAVVSEYPPGTGPDPGNFPRRNRIISGLSLGTIVVESDTDGGAMITAAMALDQDREVFAVPGTAHSRRSRGCHALIREGRAKLVETIDDVLSEIAQGLAGRREPVEARVTRAVPLPGPEKRVLDLVGADPAHVDEIAARAGLPMPSLLVHLLALEMKNLVRQLPGKYFMRPP